MVGGEEERGGNEGRDGVESTEGRESRVERVRGRVSSLVASLLKDKIIIILTTMTFVGCSTLVVERNITTITHHRQIT